MSQSKKICFFLSGLFFLCANLVFLPQGHTDPPPWAPAHGYRAKQQYYYYPGQQVYYSPDRKQYYYQDSGAWKIGVQLPSWINLGNKVVVDLDTDQPYTQHPTVSKKYPGKKKK